MAGLVDTYAPSGPASWLADYTIHSCCCGNVTPRRTPGPAGVTTAEASYRRRENWMGGEGKKKCIHLMLRGKSGD